MCIRDRDNANKFLLTTNPTLLNIIQEKQNQLDEKIKSIDKEIIRYKKSQSKKLSLIHISVKGTITLVVQEVGLSSTRLCELNEGGSPCILNTGVDKSSITANLYLCAFQTFRNSFL